MKKNHLLSQVITRCIYKNCVKQCLSNSRPQGHEFCDSCHKEYTWKASTLTISPFFWKSLFYIVVLTLAFTLLFKNSYLGYNVSAVTWVSYFTCLFLVRRPSIWYLDFHLAFDIFKTFILIFE